MASEQECKKPLWPTEKYSSGISLKKMGRYKFNVLHPEVL